jgi:hypothetical protein
VQQLTDEGRRIVDEVARRHGFSSGAVTAMLGAVSAGYGNQAQFNHQEFGGMGQWSSGGMIMIGDMFNNHLKGRINSLCQELAGLIQNQPLFAMPAQSQSQSQGGGWQGQSGGGYQQQGSGGVTGSSLFVPNAQFGNWWPADLGVPGSTGAQNNLRYAYFPGARRLAIDVGGQISVYDTGNHQIGGFSQQQSGDQSITFTSQFGLVRVADLPKINTFNTVNAATNPKQSFGSEPVAPGPTPQLAETAPASMPEAAVLPLGRNAVTPAASDDIFSLIEKLADLHKKGVLTDSEYESKKGELLSRL